MFAAFAVSEGVRARNCKGLVMRLAGQANAGPTTIKRGTKKPNPIAAVDDAIDNLFPRTLERIRPEGNTEATRLVTFARESEQQHRDLIQKIRRCSPILFEWDAKAVDEKSGLWSVCQTCSSTLNEVPSPNCPVFGNPPEQYHQVPTPG